MKLYHGSNVKIECPDLSKTKPYKDFGQGFYLSSDIKQAEELAEQRTFLMQVGEPTITCFEFDEIVMTSDELNIKIFDDYSEEWALFVLMNRDTSKSQPSHSYDIVYGPIADDNVTYQLRKYLAGEIPLEILIKKLKYSKGITFQYYFGTERALSKLSPL